VFGDFDAFYNIIETIANRWVAQSQQPGHLLKTSACLYEFQYECLVIAG